MVSLIRNRQRWDFVWEFADGVLIELRAEDPQMKEFEARKNDLRFSMRKGKISSGEYVQGFRALCMELGLQLDSLPPGYSLSKEYSVAKVYSRRA